MHHTANLSIHPSCSYSIPAVIWQRQGYTLDKESVHHRASLKDKQHTTYLSANLTD